MALNDEELQLLEAYVDGELTTGEEDALRQRLQNEPELAAALQAVRAERDVRCQIWKSYEPTPAAVERVIAHVEQAVDRHQLWAYRLSRWRVPFAAAACILVGFTVGWLGRGQSDVSPTPGDMLVSHNQPGSSLPPNSAPGGPPMQMTTVGASELVVVDEYGRVVARQQFTPQDAQKLIDTSNMWQQREEQIRNGGNIVPVNAEKF